MIAAPPMVNLDTPALVAFLEMANQKVIQAHFRAGITHCEPAKVLPDRPGPKYLRIILEGKPTDKVYCFIDRRTGDVLKAAGWATPARGVRSNIFAPDNGASGVNEWGAIYRR